MKITLKDGKELDVQKNTTVLQVAESISPQLAKIAVCGKLNGKLVDLSTKITAASSLEILTTKDPESMPILRHSASHVLAQAVKEIYPNAKLAIGPSTDDGYYYDVDFKTNITLDDLPKIEKEMAKIIKADFAFSRKELTRDKALKWAIEEEEPFKIELIESVPEGETISIYSQGNFSDICRGPHIRSTGMIKAFKLTKLAGAYWRGDENNKMLTRIYGVAFFKQSEMDEYFKRLEEAEKRDHRKLGPQLELFMLNEGAQGMPYWLPRGWKLFNTLIDYWREVHEEHGYQEISTPIINSSSLWKTSGHWDHYHNDMFLISNELDDKQEPEYAIKPMNCPNAMVVYKSKVRSYRDFPLRFSDLDVLHRFEKTGTLHGLLRVRSFRQDDSHNFISFDQIESEYNHLFDLADQFYSVFGIKYKAVFSTRPQSFLGDIEVWNECEKILKNILDKKFGEGNYKIDEGGGAFYGPKVDLMMYDALGREWQTGTFQLDMQLPSRFGLTYTDKDGQRKTPIVVHRVIYGSLERFIGILIENFAGAFPFWLSPLQVGIVPISEEYYGYSDSIKDKLKEHKIRVEVDKSDGTMGNKIKSFQLQKTPYTLVVGEKEATAGTVAVRIRGGKQVFGVDSEDFVNKAVELVKSNSLELTDKFE